jgi:hypothetical protein
VPPWTQGAVIIREHERPSRAGCDRFPQRIAVETCGQNQRALPQNAVEKAVHQAVLHAFAATGRPPAGSELDAVAAGSGRATADVLAALHELDAVRLGHDGGIAYPFFATPTRHRVRIGDRVEVYAMCAIDALGVFAMPGEDTRTDSKDVTTGHPVTVTMTATATGGVTGWDPAGAVVFIGADAAGGPSADCCCDYLNFFTDTAAALAWTAAHPQVPGQILTRPRPKTSASGGSGTCSPRAEPGCGPRAAITLQDASRDRVTRETRPHGGLCLPAGLFGRDLVMRYDLAIIGSGAAGFAAAIAARGSGRSVVMIEGGTAEGTCVSTGCVPSRACWPPRRPAMSHSSPGVPVTRDRPNADPMASARCAHATSRARARAAAIAASPCSSSASSSRQYGTVV